MRVNCLLRFEHKEWDVASKSSIVNYYKDVFVVGLKVYIPYNKRSM